MVEIWKDIIGYDRLYQVSNTGRIKSLCRIVKHKTTKGRRINSAIMSIQSNKTDGYLRITLCKNSRKKTFLVHRLVCLSFIENPETKNQVNHKNGIKTDNNVLNLEWNTHSENNLHSFEKLGRNGVWLGKSGIKHCKSKEVNQLSINGDIVNTFGSLCEAERITGINNSKISMCCNGKRNTAGGYKWKHKLQNHEN